MTNFEDLLRQYAKVDKNVYLKKLTTIKVGGKADYVLYPHDLFSLTRLIETLNKNQYQYKVIGKGSNLLCSDDDYHGAIIKLDTSLINYYYEENTLIAEAGCSIIALAVDSANKGLSNLEFACGIPATVGGTIYMNAGAYKSKMADIVTQVYVLHDGKLDWFTNEECNFAYRDSIFHQHPDWIILAAKFQLVKGDIKQIKSLIIDRRNRRISTQPLDYPSAGSVFRNPENSFAWKYIDELGLRGYQIGGAQISSKHPNFIINAGAASAKDIDDLINLINTKMQENYGFSLIMEVERFNW